VILKRVRPGLKTPSYIKVGAAVRDFNSLNFAILLINFGLGWLKPSIEHNFLFYISNLKHRLFLISSL